MECLETHHSFVGGFFLFLPEVLELKALEIGSRLVPLLVEAGALSLLARDALANHHGTANLGRSGFR